MAGPTISTKQRRSHTSPLNGKLGGRPKTPQERLATARRLYVSSALSVGEIANRSGVSRATLYRYRSLWNQNTFNVAIDNLWDVPVSAYWRCGFDGVFGYELGLLNAMSQVLNARMRLIPTPFSKIFSTVESGEVDFALSSISATTERAKRVSFTDSYLPYRDPKVRYFGLHSKLKPGLTPTAGARIGVQKQTLHEDFARANASCFAGIMAFDSRNDGEAALAAGTIDFFLSHSYGLSRNFLNRADLVSFEPERKYGGSSCIALCKQKESLGERLNQALQKLFCVGIPDLYSEFYVDKRLSAEQFAVFQNELKSCLKT